MKKLLLFCMIIILLCFIKIDCKNALEIFETNFSASNYCLYVSGVVQDLPNCKVFLYGDNSIIECDTAIQNSIKHKISNNVLGESIKVYATKKELFDFINQLNYELVSSTNVSNVELFNLYNIDIPNFINIDGQKVNLQMAFCDNIVTIGTPIILGSY